MSSDPVGAPIRLGPESQSPLPTRTWLQVRSQKCEGRQTHSLTSAVLVVDLIVDAEMSWDSLATCSLATLLHKHTLVLRNRKGG